VLIYHYTRKYCYKCFKNHVEDIKNENTLKTEAKVHQWDDGIDSDLLWFTTENTVSGGASNFLDQLVRAFSQSYYKNITKRDIDNFSKNLELQDKSIKAYNFRCYVFDSEEIKAEKWNLVKVKWSRISKKRQDYVDRIDAVSTINGDHLEDYWVSNKNVSLDLCKKQYDIVDTRQNRLERFGFKNLFDFFNWQKETVLELYKKNINDSQKIDEELGKIILERDTKSKKI